VLSSSSNPSDLSTSDRDTQNYGSSTAVQKQQRSGVKVIQQQQQQNHQIKSSNKDEQETSSKTTPVIQTSWSSNSFQKHIWTSSSSIHNSNNKNTATPNIPTLDVSPYLDPVMYCRKSSSFEVQKQRTIDGTLAAKRLRRGKQIVHDIIKYQLCCYATPEFADDDSVRTDRTNRDCNNNGEIEYKNRISSPSMSNEEYILAHLRNSSKKKTMHRATTKMSRKNPSLQQVPPPRQHVYSHSQKPSHVKAFVVTGHGVPKQLLQDHLDLCNEVVLHCSTPKNLPLSSLLTAEVGQGGECFFHSSSNTMDCSSSLFDVDWYVRMCLCGNMCYIVIGCL